MQKEGRNVELIGCVRETFRGEHWLDLVPLPSPHHPHHHEHYHLHHHLHHHIHIHDFDSRQCQWCSTRANVVFKKLWKSKFCKTNKSFSKDVHAVNSHPNEFSPASPQGNHREDTLLGRVMQVALHRTKLQSNALQLHFVVQQHRALHKTAFCWAELCKWRCIASKYAATHCTIDILHAPN